MTRSPRLGFILIIISLLLGVGLARVTQHATSTEVELTVAAHPMDVPRGGTAYLTIMAPRATAITVREGERTFPATSRGDGRWDAVIGVWAEDPVGPHPVTVEADVNGETLTATAGYTVTQRTFPIQRLRMSKAQDDKYDSPSVQEEYRLIRAAIHRHTPERRWAGPFMLPASGRISTQYGVQRYRNGTKVSLHKGIDIAARTGSPIHAANHGVVVLRRTFGLHGKTVVIDHGAGVVGLYIHLNDFGVSEGQSVRAGQLIGRVGETGVATGPHLHYALYVHGTPVDPLLWRSLPAGW